MSGTPSYEVIIGRERLGNNHFHKVLALKLQCLFWGSGLSCDCQETGSPPRPSGAFPSSSCRDVASEVPTDTSRGTKGFWGARKLAAASRKGPARTVCIQMIGRTTELWWSSRVVKSGVLPLDETVSLVLRSALNGSARRLKEEAVYL